MTFDPGWTENQWEGLVRAARGAFERSALVRRLFPVHSAPSSGAIELHQLSALENSQRARPRLRVEAERPRRPVRLGCELLVERHQLADLGLVERLAREAGHRLGSAECQLIVSGFDGESQYWNSVTIEQPDGPADSLHRAARAVSLPDVGVLFDVEGVGDARAAAQRAVVGAVKDMNARGRFGPFTLILSPEVRRHADVRVRPDSAGLGPLVDDAPTVVMALPKGTAAIVVDPAGAPLDIVDAVPPDLGIVGYEDGGVVLRFEEAVLPRVWSEEAILRLERAPAGS
jgi:uncharacterized linocin/CFP29 family protein